MPFHMPGFKLRDLVRFASVAALVLGLDQLELLLEVGRRNAEFEEPGARGLMSVIAMRPSQTDGRLTS